MKKQNKRQSLSHRSPSHRPKAPLGTDKLTSGFGHRLPPLAQSLIPLEPRFMFDGAGFATGVEVAVDTISQAQADAAIEAHSTAPAATAQSEPYDLVAALDMAAAPADTHEIVFIDSSVDGYEEFLSEIDPNAEIIILDKDGDGVEQIAAVLSSRTDISAIHIISHGDAGQLNLGTASLTAESMQGEYADELAIIQAALGQEADILIYGCNFAEGDFGEKAVGILSDLTGADVAASDDLTGAATQGGDWDLEYAVGSIEARALSSSSFQGLLAPPVPLDFTTVEYIDGANGTDTDDVYGLVSDGVDDRSVGDQYLYQDVDAANTVDALITITGYFYTDNAGNDLSVGGTNLPTLGLIDLENGTTGFDINWQPRLDTPSGGFVANSEWGVTLDVQYFLAGTTTPLDVNSFVTLLDIDGTGNTNGLVEAVSVTAPIVSVIQNDPTTLTNTLTHENGETTISVEQSLSTNVDSIVNLNPQFTTTFEVTEAAVFEIELKAITGSAGSGNGRLTSVSFDNFTYLNPVTISVPIVDLDLNDSTGATDLDFQITIPYEAGGSAIAIADTDVTITDSDTAATDMQSASIVLTNPQVGDILTVAALPAGISASGSGSDTITLSGIASIADYQDALQAISFSNTNPLIVDGSDRIIEVTIFNGDIDSPIATATIDVFGTPTVNSQTTTNTQPLITGTWDIDNGTATGLTVTIDGVPYTLGTDPELTTDLAGNWQLDLFAAGQSLSIAAHEVSVSTTNGVSTVVDQTNLEINVILNPQWSISGDIDVLEGDVASYTLSLIGAEALAPGDTLSVVVNTAGTATDGVDYTALDTALTNAAGLVAELNYDAGTNTLTYTAPAMVVPFPDLAIDLTTTVGGAEGTEDIDFSITTSGAGSVTSDVSASANSTNTTIYEVLVAPTLTAVPDGATSFTEGVDVNKDLFDTVVVSAIEPTQTLEEVVFSVSGLVDGAAEVLNIDGVAIALTNGNAGSTASYTYSVSEAAGIATVTISTTGASSASIQTVVDGMSYQNNLTDTPTAGDRIVTIVSLTDSGASNNQSAIGISETVTVIAVNDDPVVGAPVLPLAYSGPLDIHGTGFSVADIDAGPGTDIQVTLSVDEGTIAGAIGNSGLTSLTGSGSSTVVLTGTTTEIDNFLRGFTSGTIVYTAIGLPNFDATFTVTANDLGNTGIGGGGNVSNTVTINTLLNNAPVLDLELVPAGTGYSTAFVEGGGAVNITSGTVSLTDIEGDEVTLEIVAANIADGVNEILNFGAGQIFLDGSNNAILNNVTVGGVVVDVFYTAATQTLLITDNNGDSLPLVDAVSVLEAITYQNDDGTATLAPDRTFSITADDGVVSNTAISTISLTNIENPPINTVPGAQVVNEDALLNLTGLSVNDTDGDLQTVQLTVTNGDLNVSLAGGATISAGANDSNTLTLSGTQIEINAALSTLTYQGTTNYNGPDTLQIVSADADGGTADDTDNVLITVNSVNDAPLLNTGSATDYAINEGASTAGTLFSAIDIDPVETGVVGEITAASIDITGTIDGNDSLTINGVAITALNVDIGPTSIGGGHTYSIVSGTLTIAFAPGTSPDAAETILNGLTFTAASGDVANHTTTFTLNSVTDNGGVANGGSDTVTGLGLVSNVAVTAINELLFTATGNAEAFVEDGAATGPLFVVSVLDTVETSEDITAVVINLTNTEAGDTLLIGITSVDVGVDAVTGPDVSGYTFTVSGGGTVLTISHAGQTEGTIEALLEGITFTATDDSPTTAQRGFTIDTITDDGGLFDVVDVSATVDITPVNDAPTIDLDDDDSTSAGDGYTGTFTVGGAAVNIADVDVFVDDVDTAGDAFSLTIVAGNLLDGTDEVLNFGAGSIIMDGTNDAILDNVNVNGTLVDVAYTAATNTFVITDSTGGTLTLVQVTTILEAIEYQNNSLTPDTALPRTFSVTLNDGALDSNTAISQIAVSVDFNDEPVVATLAGVDDTFTEGDLTTAVLFNNSDIDPIEPGQNIDQLIFTVSNVNDGANESLGIDGTSIVLTDLATATGANYNISVSVVGTTATVTLTAITPDTVIPATADSVVNGVTYSNTSAPPTTSDRVVTLTTIVDSGLNTGLNDNINNAVNVFATVTMVATTADVDGDGVGDPTDLDDDNDGILDTDEDAVTVPNIEVINISGAQAGSYTVLDNGPVSITIRAGDGGDEDATIGGQGASITATFNMIAGEEIVFVVGDAGESNNGNDTAGGGGSTGVYIGDSTNGYRLVMVAGAGGAGEGGGGAGQGGQLTTAGGDDSGNSFAGGTNGTGGTTGASAGGGGGVGDPFGNTNGNGANGDGGTSGAGLSDTDPSDGLTLALGGTTNANGGNGFTAGGAGSDSEGGGGGGYSGGGAGGTTSATDGGGGGGSFLDTGDAAFVSGGITAGTDGGGSQSNGNLSINIVDNDTDGDGTTNSLDLDSDNDGISDLLESGVTSAILAFDTNSDGTISLAEGLEAGGTLNNGVWDFFGVPGGFDGTTLTDFDADGIDDYIDLDSDNDGIADTIEARPTSGYVANDGDVTNNDADGDGVIDLFDSNDTTSAIFGGTFSTPQDTDGDGNADYLDTDSDDDLLLDTAESGLTLTGSDANNDGIDDNASIGAGYADPDGVVNNPSTGLANEFGDSSEIAYRERPIDAVMDTSGVGVVNEDTGTILAINLLNNDVTIPAIESATLDWNPSFDMDVLDDDAGAANQDWVDSTGSALWSLDANVTLNTAPVTSLPGITAAYVFDGSGASGAVFDFGQTGTQDSFTNITGDPSNNSATFEIWFKDGGSAIGEQIIFETGGGGDGVSLKYNDSTHVLTLATKDSGTTLTNTFDLDDVGIDASADFIQVAWTYDRNNPGTTDTVTLYVNGSVAGAVLTSATLNDWAGGNDGGLGRSAAGINVAGGSPFEGEISIFRFYESALSLVNIQQNYTAVAGPTVTSVDSDLDVSTAVAPGAPATITTDLGGLVTVSSDGSITYDPNAQTIFTDLNFGDDPVLDSFTYTISNASGATDTATIFVTVEANNQFKLSSLTTGGGDQGAIFNGINPGDESGFVVSSAGDLNGDGFDDFAIGAPRADPNGGQSGQTYVVFGQAGDFNPVVELSALDGSNGFILNGVDFDDHSARAISAGDVNGDGLSDLIIGAVRADPNSPGAGETYVIFGKNTPFDATFELSSLAAGDGSTGFVLNGIDNLDSSGRTVAFAGDVNGDGIGDILIGASTADSLGNSRVNAGETYLVYGRSDFSAILSGGEFELSSLALDVTGANGTVFNGLAATDYSGRSVSGAGDVNGDGFDDIIIGAAYASPAAGAYAGTSYVVFGQDGGFGVGEFDLASLDGTNGFALTGEAATDYSGSNVSSAGDFNGDGFADVVVSATYADANGNVDSGKTYIIYGKDTAFSASISLSAADVTINGAIAGHFSGASASSAGDVNGDGFDDLVIGRELFDYYGVGGLGGGQSYVVFGGASIPATLDTADFIPVSANGGTVTSTVPQGFVLSGIIDRDYAGVSVSAAGDVNGDGFDDLIVGANYADPNGTTSGQSYIIYGKDYRAEGSITGSSVADNLDGGAGNDALNSGAGDDTLVFDASDIRRVDGGGGTDTLSFTGSATTLDLTSIPNTVYKDIEVIDLAGGSNTLILDVLDLFALSGSSNILTINGTGADTVTLSDLGSWTMTGVSGGYDIYEFGEAVIRIQTGINVTAIQPVEDKPQESESGEEFQYFIEDQLSQPHHVQELVAGLDPISTSGLMSQQSFDLERETDTSLYAEFTSAEFTSVSEPQGTGVMLFSQQVHDVANTFSLEAGRLMGALES